MVERDRLQQGRAALARPVLGLALGAGAMRGAAHVGVLRALEQAGLEPQVVVGSSVGSLVGALYAAGVSIRAMQEAAPGLVGEVQRELRLSPWGMLALGSRLTLEALRRATPSTPGGMVAGHRLERWLRRHLPVDAFDDLVRPFAAVACDLHSGETVLLTRWDWVHRPLPLGTAVVEGVSLAAAVRASCSIPWFYTPRRLAGRALVDGGAVEPVPARACRLLGADVVVAVDLGTGHRRDGNIHGLTRVLDRAAAIALQRLTDLQVERFADVAVRPALADGPPEAPSTLRQWEQAGYEATCAAVGAIRRSLSRAAAMADRTVCGAVPPVTDRAAMAASTWRQDAASGPNSGL